MVFVFPASSNYRLDNFQIGPGGSDDSASTNYQMETVVGEQSDDGQASSNYQLGLGLEFVQMANTPPAPTWLNGGNYYNKLRLIIDEGNNSADTEYAVAISDDDFTTTRYVQDDFTVGDVLGSEDWQTYTDWGGASGEFVVGLQEDTTYKVMVKARQGLYTEGTWGPVATADTDPLSLEFDIDVAATDQETVPPYAIDFGDLTIGAVNDATDKVWVDIATNGEGGAYVYIYGDSGGLYSASKVNSITSVTGNLAVLDEGYGVRVDTTSETSGGPLIAESPYDGAADNVGTIDTAINVIYSSSSSSVVGGRGSAVFKAKVDALTPAASDYSILITVIASATF